MMIVEHCIHLFSCNYHPLLNPNMYFTHTTSPTPTHSPPLIHCTRSPPPWASIVTKNGTNLTPQQRHVLLKSALIELVHSIGLGLATVYRTSIN